MKYCNKTLLVTTLIGRQLFTREDEISIDEKFIDFLNRYLDEQFYRSNFFELAGVCKKLAYSEEVNEGFAAPTGIYSLPKPLQLMFVDYIPLTYYFPFKKDEMDVVGVDGTLDS